MIFTAPLVLLGLLSLPAIVLLLRLNPPAAQRIRFPPLALLRELSPHPHAPRHIPLWLLLLRLAAAAAIIIALAGPALHAPAALAGNGPELLVIDNGWASAADWPQRRSAASRLIAAAARNQTPVAILATAADANHDPLLVTAPLSPAEAQQFIAALQPEPWPVDRAAAAAVLKAAPQPNRSYIADGITDGPGFTTFLGALRPASILSSTAMPSLLLPPVREPDGRLIIHRLGATGPATLTGQASNGDVLLRTSFSAAGDAVIDIPPALANRLATLSLDGPPAAGSTLILDNSSHTLTVGLTAGGADADLPYTGSLYFLRRALAAGSQIMRGTLPSLLAARPDLIFAADAPIPATQQADLQSWIAAGGTLIRFAGPLTATTTDPLNPDALLSGERRLGGALTWSTAQHIAPFPRNSPLSGLPIDPNVTVARQILADATTLDPSTVWASLDDGTPLVLGTARGKGHLITILTTANAAWSNLAVSGLYPGMLQRLAALAEGGAAVARPHDILTQSSALSAFGSLVPATGTAQLTEAGLAGIAVSPAHPPGIYGSGDTSIALNLGSHVPPPIRADLPDAAPLAGGAPQDDLGPPLMCAAILLLAADVLISLRRRGLLTLLRVAVFCLALLPSLGQAQSAALQTSLGYILTGDPVIDQRSADALAYISADAAAHTSAPIISPVALDPARDDLAYYPLIYWPVPPSTAAPSPAACAALTNYMQHGGLLVIDTLGGEANAPGSGAGFAPGAAAALARATACLNLPALEPLTSSNVLAHCFYILSSFPGRFDGAPVLVAAPAGRDADGSTPVIIGSNDWQGAWARDDTGDPEQTPLPGGEPQRTIADRFGTNLIIYALTGDYKADQGSTPRLLDKLGQ